ncbi:hypothetical protein ACMHYO_19505 [Allopusillimonas ginsengisoli]|uniref:hypothetical protein n=1 Tax=Allopusillimonas ginsengisoli TaxID=453575 RepID=UPI0039C05174
MKPDSYVAEFQAALDRTDPRASLSARLRPLLPRIHERINAGSPYSAILDDLEGAGLVVKRRMLESALYRWRKARIVQATTSPAPAPLRPTPTKALPSPDVQAVTGRPDRIETPADLRKIRDMKIDLDALRREGEASRKLKREQHAPHTKNPQQNQE